MEIKVEDHDLEKALKAMKRKIQREGLLKDLKKRSFYEKPSEKKKRKRIEARRKKARALKMRRSR